MNVLGQIGITLLGQASKLLEQRELTRRREIVEAFLALTANVEEMAEAERARIEAMHAEARANLQEIDERLRRLKSRTLARELNAAFQRRTP